ncbi:unnamed protein product [Ascophyllum nodosum]
MWTSALLLWVNLYATVLFGEWWQGDGELVQLVAITRHGSRAPNAVARELCPANEANRLAYNVPPGQLTESGMRQAYKLGVFIRKTYVESLSFLPPTLEDGRHEHFSSQFVSESATRCLQTAQAMAQGLFPNGTGPPGFPNQPVAVQSEQPPFANLLAAPQGACLSKRKADDKAFDESRGKAIIRNAGNLTDIVAEACGTSVKDYDSENVNGGQEGQVLAVKDMSDMLDFDEYQGLPRFPAMSNETHARYIALAFTLLQERYYSNKKQVTYWAGDLPLTLFENFDAASEQHSMGYKPERLFYSYHGHRELLFALAHLLGWKFDVPGMPTALGMSSIPPATTMFLELHHHDHGTDTDTDPEDNVTAHEFRPASVTGHESAQGGRHGDEEHENNYEYYIRTYTWTPLFGQKEVVLNVCSDAQPGKGCPLSTLKSAILDGVVNTGSWQDICHHVPFEEAEEMAKKIVYSEGDATDATGQGGSTQPPHLTSRLSTVAVAVASTAVMLLIVLAAKGKCLSSGARRGEKWEILP